MTGIYVKTNTKTALAIRAVSVIALSLIAVLLFSSCTAADQLSTRSSGEENTFASDQNSSMDSLSAVRMEKIYLRQTKQNGRTITPLSASPSESDSATTQVQLNTRAGTAEFQVVALYSDDSEEVLTSGVSWASSSPDIARVSGGVVTAISDGEVEITASVKAYSATENDSDDVPSNISSADTSDIRTFTAKAILNITGQVDNPYITDLEISVPEDPWSPISGYLNEGADIYDSYIPFCAIVHTVDPETGQEDEYSTANGSLLDQTDGRIADITWNVVDNDTSSGAVQDSSGIALYIPLNPTTVELRASSQAGVDNTTLTASVDITSKLPAGQVDPQINHPQESLSIYCYWHDYPPSDEEKKNPEESDKFVIEAHYTPEEVAALGMHRNRYTLIRNNELGYSALYAQGPYLEDLLSDVFFKQSNSDLADVSIDAVNSLTFFCYDGLYGHAVSGSYLLETDEYYYPYIYTQNPEDDAKIVKPEIALFSFKTLNDNEQEYSDDAFFEKMDDANRFRLALGANLDTMLKNQQLAVKWINTIFIELKGGPAVSSGDGQPVAGDAEAGTSLTLQEVGASGEGSGDEFRIYQVMNHFNPFTDTELAYSNPLIVIMVVLALAAFITGGLSAGVYYRRQLHRRSAIDIKVCCDSDDDLEEGGIN